MLTEITECSYTGKNKYASDNPCLPSVGTASKNSPNNINSLLTNTRPISTIQIINTTNLLKFFESDF